LSMKIISQRKLPSQLQSARVLLTRVEQIAPKSGLHGVNGRGTQTKINGGPFVGVLQFKACTETSGLTQPLPHWMALHPTSEGKAHSMRGEEKGGEHPEENGTDIGISSVY
jgi:hypothetical protein